MTIAIGCDHIGLTLKNDVIAHLKNRELPALIMAFSPPTVPTTQR